VKPSEALQTHREAIRQLVGQYHIRNIRVFGSVLHGDDTEDSDLDLLVDPAPQTTLMDLAAIQIGLQKLLGVSVDVLTPADLPVKFRQRVLQEARLV
jgi:predicted nucleotidyltransferase